MKYLVVLLSNSKTIQTYQTGETKIEKKLVILNFCLKRTEPITFVRHICCIFSLTDYVLDYISFVGFVEIIG
jgi:hypothetical protein